MKVRLINILIMYLIMILLLPSIKQIKFEPGHTRVKTIKRIKKIPEKNLKEEGWLKSKPNSTENNN